MCIHDGFYSSVSSAILSRIPSVSQHHHFSAPPIVLRTSSLTSSEPAGIAMSRTSSSESSDSDTSLGSVLIESETSFQLTSIAEEPPSFLCLTQRLGKGAVGETWKGVFSQPGVTLDVAAKVGFSKDSRQHLINEAEIYEVLRQKDINGVPVMIGLFDDSDDQVPILVTTYAGEEICNIDTSLR